MNLRTRTVTAASDILDSAVILFEEPESDARPVV